MDIKKSFKALKSYCEAEDFKGWDPYDGLNSKGVSGVTAKALGFRESHMDSMF